MAVLLTVVLLGLLLLGTYRIADSVRSLAANAIVGNIDSGTVAGVLEVRTSTQPTNVGDADNGTLLGTLTFSKPAFGLASAGVATAAAITSDSSADASGTATHFRVKNRYNSVLNIHSDGTCGLGSGDLNFDNNVIVAGGVIAITSATVTVPT